MNEISVWMRGNWYALGNLLAQFAFLIAAVWFARKILKTIRSTQEQFGALLKLSMSDGLGEHAKLSEATVHRPTPYVMAEWPAIGEAPALALPEREPLHKRLQVACHGVVLWLNTPMSTHGHAHWRKMIHWLQTPAGN